VAKSFFGQIFQVEGQPLGHRFSIESGENLLFHRFGVHGDYLSHKFLVLPNNNDGLIGSVFSGTTTTPFGAFSGQATSTQAPIGEQVPQATSTDDEFGPYDWVETGFPEPLTHAFMVFGTPFRHRFGVHGDPFGHRFIVLITDASSDYGSIVTGIGFPFGDNKFVNFGIESPFGDAGLDSWTFIPPLGLQAISSNSFELSNPQGDTVTFDFIVGGRLLHEFNTDHIDVPPAVGVPHTLGQVFDIPYINTQDFFGHKLLTSISTQDILESTFNVNQITSPPAIGTGNVLPSRFNIAAINAIDIVSHKFFGVLGAISRLHHGFSVPISTADLLSHRLRVKPFRLRTRFLSTSDRQLVNTSGQKQVKFAPLKTKTTRPK